MKMLNRKKPMTVLFATVWLLGLFLTTACQALSTAASPAGRPKPTPALLANHAAARPTATGPDTIQLTGTFKAPDQVTLTFTGSGRITDLRVQEGVRVKQGEVLAALDTTELQVSVKQAQAVLAGARARLDQASAPATTADIKAAQAAVDSALKNYEKVRAGPTVNDLAALKAQVDNAKAAVDQAQAAYDKIGGATNPYIGMAPQALQLQTATNNYTAALAAYNNALAHPTAAELAAAQAQVQQEQDALARLQPTSDSIAAAQAQVDQAQAAFELAQQQVSDATLTAPFDGTILAVGPHAGETVGPTTRIVALADLTHMQLEVGVDQDLISQIQIGQTVAIVPDAFKESNVTGQVSRIGWLATSTAGVTDVVVTIDVNSSDVPLRPGLTGMAEFSPGK
jgi:HlyD family secretion protein